MLRADNSVIERPLTSPPAHIDCEEVEVSGARPGDTTGTLPTSDFTILRPRRTLRIRAQERRRCNADRMEIPPGDIVSEARMAARSCKRCAAYFVKGGLSSREGCTSHGPSFSTGWECSRRHWLQTLALISARKRQYNCPANLTLPLRSMSVARTVSVPRWTSLTSRALS